MKIVKNVGDMDRIIRMVGGVILLLLVLLLKPPLAAGIFLVLLGLILVATGYLRFCPLYSALKIKTLRK